MERIRTLSRPYGRPQVRSGNHRDMNIWKELHYINYLFPTQVGIMAATATEFTNNRWTSAFDLELPFQACLLEGKQRNRFTTIFTLYK